MIVAHWEPPAELTRLLEALAHEIVSATDSEVNIASVDSEPTARPSWRKAQASLARMRELVDDAIDEPREARQRARLPELEAIVELRHRPN